MLMASLTARMADRVYIQRERRAGMYGSLPCALAQALVELPWLALIALTSVPILYGMLGFNTQPAPFLTYILTQFIILVLFVYLGQLLAAGSLNGNVAQGASGFVILLLFW